jgi:hypothetical protein
MFTKGTRWPGSRIGERPDEARQSFAGTVHFVHALGIVDRRFDLAAVANDPGVSEKSLNLRFVEASNLLRVEVGERFPEFFALAQHGDPGETTLEPLEANLFEEAMLVDDGTAPLVVVVAPVLVAPLTPWTTKHGTWHGNVIPRRERGR